MISEPRVITALFNLLKESEPPVQRRILTLFTQTAAVLLATGGSCVDFSCSVVRISYDMLVSLYGMESPGMAACSFVELVGLFMVLCS